MTFKTKALSVSFWGRGQGWAGSSQLKQALSRAEVTVAWRALCCTSDGSQGLRIRIHPVIRLACGPGRSGAQLQVQIGLEKGRGFQSQLVSRVSAELFSSVKIHRIWRRGEQP